MPRGFLVGLADGEPRQHLALAAAERFAAGHIERDLRRIVRQRRLAVFAEGFLEAVDDLADADRLDQKIEGAAPDRIDCHRDGAMNRRHENRRRAVLRTEFLQHVESRAVGDVDFDEDTRRRARSRIGQQGGAVGEADDVVTDFLQAGRQGFPCLRVVVDDEYLTFGSRLPQHSSTPAKRFRSIWLWVIAGR